MQINWLYEINAWYEWKQDNEITPTDEALWNALMYLLSRKNKGNYNGDWDLSLTPSNSILCARSGLSIPAMHRARNKLQQRGRIKFCSRKGNQATMYTIIPFALTSVKQNEQQNGFALTSVKQIDRQTLSKTNSKSTTYINIKPKEKQNYPPTPNSGDSVPGEKFAPFGSNGRGRVLPDDMGLEGLVWDFTPDHDLRAALGEWAEMRAEKGKLLTATMLRRNLDDLQRLAGDVTMQRAIVDQSTRKGWTGFYPIDHIPDKKRYPKADCPRCHGEGYYLAADGHTMVECDCKDG